MRHPDSFPKVVQIGENIVVYFSQKSAVVKQNGRWKRTRFALSLVGLGKHRTIRQPESDRYIRLARAWMVRERKKNEIPGSD